MKSIFSVVSVEDPDLIYFKMIQMQILLFFKKNYLFKCSRFRLNYNRYNFSHSLQYGIGIKRKNALFLNLDLNLVVPMLRVEQISDPGNDAHLTV